MSEPIVETPEPFHVRYRYRILLLITLAGAIMRFATLDRPTLWGDEALTYSRVIGTWDEMFAILRTDGFMPLHYVLYWLLGKCVTLTPSMMRLIPAICGTLMIPALYFFVRQLSSVGAALLAAGLTCCSAYLMRYSHDAKMYIQTWCWITINLGCLLWWIRTKKWTAYLAWTLSGIVAGGFSALALLMVLPQLVIFISSKKARIISSLLFLLGVLVIVAPVAVYMTQINHWADRTGVLPSLSKDSSPGNWEDSGISWIDWYNAQATSYTLIRGSWSAYITGWEWPAAMGTEKIVSYFVIGWHVWILSFIAIVLLLSILPWKKSLHHQSNFQGWQRFLWIAVLILIPAYGVFYCRSIPGFYSPSQAMTEALHAISYWGLLLIPIIFGYWFYSADTIKSRMKSTIPWLVSLLLIFIICQSMYWIMAYEHERHWQKMAQLYGSMATLERMPQLEWKSIWMPRYIGVIVPALFAGVSILIMRLPGVWLKAPVIAIILGFNFSSSITGLIVSPEPPLDRYMADAKETRDSRGRTRVVVSTLDRGHRQKSLFMQSSWYGLYGSAGKYYASIVLDLKPTPNEFREGNLADRFRQYLGELVDPEEIESATHYGDSELTQPVERLIVWDHSSEQSERPDQIPQPDAIIQVLSKNWNEIGREEIFYQYDSNCWADKGFNRRRVFAKK